MNGAIAVVIPVRNRERWIARAIESALAQTLAPREILVIDDGSSDRSAEIAESFGDRVRVLRQDHAGAYVARNRAIRATDAEFIAFLDSDDAWLPHKLALQMPLFDDERVGVVFGNAIIRHFNGDRVTTGRTLFQNTAPRAAALADFVRGNFIPFSTAIVRREAFARCGFFDEPSRLSGDYVAFFRIALQYRLAYVRDVVAEYSVHEGSWSLDLVASLESRIALFEEELQRTRANDARRVIEQLLFNLHVHLAVAYLRRGRFAAARHAWPKMRRELPRWAGALFFHQLRRRLLRQ
ncbi:MAG: glycosyltransferase [Acidobacteriota bacterium]|nr:glycosyltransferase [Acidobacteriota bacterium]